MTSVLRTVLVHRIIHRWLVFLKVSSFSKNFVISCSVRRKLTSSTSLENIDKDNLIRAEIHRTGNMYHSERVQLIWSSVLMFQQMQCTTSWVLTGLFTKSCDVITSDRMLTSRYDDALVIPALKRPGLYLGRIPLTGQPRYRTKFLYTERLKHLFPQQHLSLYLNYPAQKNKSGTEFMAGLGTWKLKLF